MSYPHSLPTPLPTENVREPKKKVVYIRHGSSTDEAGPDEIADMGTETVQVEKPDVSLEFEFTTDSWVEQQFGPRLPGQEPKIVTYNYIKVYAKNLSGGLAHHFEGSIWVPVQFLFQVLFERQIARAKTTEEIINSEPYQIEINNKLSVGSRIQFQNPPPAEWQPFSPGRRLLLKKIVLMPHYEQMMRRFPCSIPWQFSVNGGDVVKGATKFADIPYLDNRSPAHKK